MQLKYKIIIAVILFFSGFVFFELNIIGFVASIFLLVFGLPASAIAFRLASLLDINDFRIILSIAQGLSILLVLAAIFLASMIIKFTINRLEKSANEAKKT